MIHRNKMPYEEDKLQDVSEEDEHDKKREKKKHLSMLI